MDFNENIDSSSDNQYFEEVDCGECVEYDENLECDENLVENLEYIQDDFCILDIENNKINELTKTMNDCKLRLENFDTEPLNNISELKRNIYLLCEDNRYLIDDSKFLSNLELLIHKDIYRYEDKLFILSEQLVDNEINKELTQTISSDKTKENHERLIYGEKLANERKLAREKDIENIHYLIKLENERKELALLKENVGIRNYINSLKDNDVVIPVSRNQINQINEKMNKDGKRKQCQNLYY